MWGIYPSKEMSKRKKIEKLGRKELPTQSELRKLSLETKGSFEPPTRKTKKEILDLRTKVEEERKKIAAADKLTKVIEEKVLGGILPKTNKVAVQIRKDVDGILSKAFLDRTGKEVRKLGGWDNWSPPENLRG